MLVRCVILIVVLLFFSLAKADASEILFSTIQKEGRDIRLQVQYPGGFTNRLDLFACTNLTSGYWIMVLQEASTAGTNALSWLDSGAGQFQARFYCVGDAGVDADSDGLPDARETLIYRTNPGLSDTDFDGIPDGTEIVRGTDPLSSDSGVMKLYADSDIGNDAYDGWAGAVGAWHGPKRSIRATYIASYRGDTLQLQGGAIFVEPMLSLGGKSVVLCPQGEVTLRP
ncbi:MAG: hypothetical protein WCL49_06255 [bacterium]